MSSKNSLTFTRIGIYIILAIILIITIVPIWLLLVNATRSTTEIQNGISILPSSHTFENYNILVGKGLDLPRGFMNSLIMRFNTTLCHGLFRLSDRLWDRCLSVQRGDTYSLAPSWCLF